MTKVGKLIGDSTYVHLSAFELLSSAEAVNLVNKAIGLLPSEAVGRANVVKVNLNLKRVSFLEYFDFDDDPFPVLKAGWTLSMQANLSVGFRSYCQSSNPPILHRKELLVSPDHPLHSEWSQTTVTCEELGLFDEPKTIGFLLNWEKAISRCGYRLSGKTFHPIGNASGLPEVESLTYDNVVIHRHLTAMSRTGLSAPVQLLIRHGLLVKDVQFFDYGCGRGDDLATLATSGFRACGWDPHYASDSRVLDEAYVVNLGFVINVIEDPAERVEALNKAFRITRGVMAVSVMLYGPERVGRTFRDGVITSRGTFQKYFSQDELKDYLEDVLHQEVFLVAPGIAFVFFDKELEQRFIASRYRSRALGVRMFLASQRIAQKSRVPRPQTTSRTERRLELARPALERIWHTSLELGRYPEWDELPAGVEFNEAVPSLKRGLRLIGRHYDLELLDRARRTRIDDLQLYFAMQYFSKRTRYKQLELRLQRDIAVFFGDYATAQSGGLQLLMDAANPEAVLSACKQAAENGYGWLEKEHALQVHIDLVDRLPVLLRTYVACAMILTGGISDTKIVKIHIVSGKLTLMEFEDFETSPLPRMTRRIKVNLKSQSYELFEYGEKYPKPTLYRKSRYLHEDSDCYAEQLSFDEALEALGILSDSEFGPTAAEFDTLLEKERLCVQGFELVPSRTIPELDAKCGANLTYRDLIECGETQQALHLANLPKLAQTYNSLHGLAKSILDPLIDYFGAIKLTYGFCSKELSRHIKTRIAPQLDQHASEELTASGALICSRGGAACDFLVEHEDMREVAEWVIGNLPFDRLYFYGSDRPVHVSWSISPASKAYEMLPSKSGRRIPKPFSR